MFAGSQHLNIELDDPGQVLCYQYQVVNAGSRGHETVEVEDDRILLDEAHQFVDETVEGTQYAHQQMDFLSLEA